MGILFFWEKQLASLRHLFPARKAPPYHLARQALVVSHQKIIEINAEGLGETQ
jgi:hypothetical protein